MDQTLPALYLGYSKGKAIAFVGLEIVSLQTLKNVLDSEINGAALNGYFVALPGFRFSFMQKVAVPVTWF